MRRNINKYGDLLLTAVTVTTLPVLFLAQSFLTYFLAAEFFSLILVFSFVYPSISKTTEFINIVSNALFWPRSRNWLWICAVLLNVIVFYEIFK